MYQNYLKQLGNNIKTLRKSNNLSQLELAKLANTSQAAVNKWEHGQSDPTSFNILTLAKIFKITTDELINDSLHTPNTKNIYTLKKTFRKVDLEENNEFIIISIKK